MKRKIIALIILGLFVTVGVLWATLTTTNYPQKNQQETCTLAGLTASSAGSGRQCAMVNNDPGGGATNDVDDQVYVKYKTGTGPTGTSIAVFAYACLNSSTANCIDAGEVNGTDAAITIPTTGTIMPAAVGPAVCYANVGATNYICGPFSIAQTFGNSVPSGWGIVIQNNSGVAFDATCAGCGVFYDRVNLKNGGWFGWWKNIRTRPWGPLVCLLGIALAFVIWPRRKKSPLAIVPERYRWAA